jgi:hypothetical protein
MVMWATALCLTGRFSGGVIVQHWPFSLLLWNHSFSATQGEELTIDLLSLGLPHRSIDSPLSFERVAIPSTEFAI